MVTSNLIQVIDSKLWDKIDALCKEWNKAGGVYKLIALSNGVRIPINRFLSQDIEGVLYIGKATSFLRRVIDLKKSIMPDYNSASHDCGSRYKSNNEIAKRFPIEGLYIQLCPSDTPGILETELLMGYRSTFGEVPPLNAI